MFEELEHIDWEKFHFIRADFWWISIPIFVIIVLGVVLYEEQNSWKKNIAKHLQPFVIQKGTVWKTRIRYLSVLLMFAISFIGFLGPTWNEVKAPSKKVQSQLVIALDLSQSMLVNDVLPTRLERAKFKIHDLLKSNPRAETSLIVFAASTHMVIPFTTDYKIIIDQLDGLLPRMMPVQGTGFNVLFTKMDTLFSDNKVEGKMLLITDDLEDLSVESISDFVQENKVRLYVYPFATQMGGTIPKSKETSKLSIDKLDALAAIENVYLLNLTLDESDVDDLAKVIRANLVFEDESEGEEEDWEENGNWFVIPLAILFLFTFRKGWSLNMIVIALMLNSCTTSTNEKTVNFSFNDLWYTQEYQAQQEFDQGNYYEAARGFSDPMRTGVAYFKAGDFISALNAFEQDTTGTSLYNLGLTYAKLGMLEKAEDVFNAILQQDPSNKNATANLNHIMAAKAEIDKLTPEELTQNEDGEKAKNAQNDSPEDLGGGGQEATKKDMEKERKEETTDTGMRKGKELDELPDDFESGKGSIPKNILLRKVDDDPALFLTRKFRYQVKKKLVEVEKTAHKW